MSYARTYPEFWTSRVSKLDDVSRSLAHFLYSAPNVPLWGLYHRPLRTMAAEFGRTEAIVRAALKKLAGAEFVQTDEDTGYVWVIEQAAYQLRPLPLKGNNLMVRSARRWYATLPKNPFLGPFYDRYDADLLLSDKASFPGSEVIRRDYGLIVAAQPSLLGEEPAPEPTSKKGDRSAAFQEWIDAYPTHRRAPTKRAEDVWKRRKLGPSDVPRMLQALTAQKRMHDWQKNQGQYVPKACNYLRDELDKDARLAAPTSAWKCPHRPLCASKHACDERYYQEEIARG